jgi:copper chaperone CopZ
MQQTYEVPDISCGHCKQAIETALLPLEGVDRASVDIEARTVTVDLDPGRTNGQEVVKAIEAAGYPVKN